MQAVESLHAFRNARNLLFPPADACTAAGFVSGHCSAHDKEGIALKVVNLPAHEVDDVIGNKMDIPTMPLLGRQTLNPFVVFVISIQPKDGEGFLAEPLEPMMVFFVIVPEKTEVSQYDDIIFPHHLALFWKICGIELADIDWDMGIARKVNHRESFRANS